MLIKRLPTRAGLAAAAGASLLALAACGTPTLAKADVEKQISTQLQAQVGKKPDKVTCPDDLAGKVGTKMRCTLTDSGTSYGVTVTVTKVDGSKVDFNIQVDNKPSS